MQCLLLLAQASFFQFQWNGKDLKGLSLDCCIEGMRELPAQEDYVILHLSALL